MGWYPLPFDEEQIFEGVSSAAAIIVGLWTWYRNNNTTDPALEAQAQLERIKRLERGAKKQ